MSMIDSYTVLNVPAAIFIIEERKKVKYAFTFLVQHSIAAEMITRFHFLSIKIAEEVCKAKEKEINQG
ncbi:hypothetical protein Lal_00026032 [Lupinus albus]|uniref:Uncharacterized protein n=1 Tax=Lupinus albus TaxID=3870 RepID=A0A6A4PYK6_LUPAL|nr:hypothetical protein Lalb_Chr09g0323181 [Lupinus albus]KAF1861638.1 hypothetical protein Lal_00026032 [Lupinus albus]